MHDRVSKRLDPLLMASDGPILTPDAVVAVIGDDEEAKHVLWQINSRKAVSLIYNWEDNFRDEKFYGFSVTLKQGCLGLQKCMAD
jgi:hypothetical protein